MSFIKNFKGLIVYYIFKNGFIDKITYNKYKEIFNQLTGWSTLIHNLQNKNTARDTDKRLENYGTMIEVNENIITLKSEWIDLLKKNINTFKKLKSTAEFDEIYDKDKHYDNIKHMFIMFIKKQKKKLSIYI